MKLTKKIDLSPLTKAATPSHALCQLAAAITHYDKHVTLAEYTELAVFANNLAELTESASVASVLILQSLDKKITHDQALARLRNYADQMDLTKAPGERLADRSRGSGSGGSPSRFS